MIACNIKVVVSCIYTSASNISYVVLYVELKCSMNFESMKILKGVQHDRKCLQGDSTGWYQRRVVGESGRSRYQSSLTDLTRHSCRSHYRTRHPYRTWQA